MRCRRRYADPHHLSQFPPQVLSGQYRPSVRDMYGPLRPSYQQLSGEMVGLEHYSTSNDPILNRL
jgi:hypothetical protein